MRAVRVVIGIIGAVLLLSVMLVGVGGTMVLALWMIAMLLLPMGEDLN